MFEKNVKTNMELEITEQTKIIPYILMKYINPETGRIKIDLPDNITKIILVASGSHTIVRDLQLICWKSFPKLNHVRFIRVNFF